MKILVTRAWPKATEDRLTNAGLGDVTLRHPDTPMSHDEWMEAAKTYDVIMPTVSDKIPAEFYPAAKGKVKIFANYGVGFNHIDIDAAAANGIAVTNTPDVLTDCTADLAMGLLLAAARRIGEGERETRAGGWEGWRPTHMIGKKVTGATLGIIGFGRIGQAMARRAHNGFGMRVVFQDAWEVPEDIKSANGNAEQLPSMVEVAAEADFLSLHCPGGADTYKMINAIIFNALKPGAILVNSARGDVVDEDALFEALDSGQLSAAGLDVYHNEPALDPRFLKYDNIVLAPHLGSATDGTREAMGFRAIDNLEAFLKGDTPGDLVTPK
ncbi:2-hydroxyacid dehydrogenase [Roseovarius atlanticus]|uniref:2-hydroxyacid dehydrogenase n=1 Tax=Roseovarius atlanticus TaxID=1641875 RepID=UPI001C96766D|nr:D-glycerate dehydrogenase [Roseovarius atlanticus]MBY5989004.1 D-glycerate dehydrogenase [Roseovarius atlanticus]MBY6124396.1 D-glycerate dehydrogenase [Roseovarius atlanticus]MBY6148891.1 D-glycerate dehydrogenase [Roseovarius atlanticus]